MGFEFSRSLALVIGPNDTGSLSACPAIDSAFVHNTSGDAFFALITPPVTQSGTLTVYVYVTAVTGTPDFQLEVRDSDTGSGDIDRPLTSGSNLATSPSTLSLTAADANKWKSLTCSVNMTRSAAYFVILKNTHATPASNYATFAYRGALDGWGNFPGGSAHLASGCPGYTLNGFTSDPTMNPASTMGPLVMKFSDGSLIGMPYVSSAAHASNANSRGNRFTFTEDVVVSGIISTMGTSGVITGGAIYDTSGTLIASAVADTYMKQRSLLTRFAPVTLVGGTAYDVVNTVSSATGLGTFYTMGEAEGSLPADVIACRAASIAAVTGTPGSMTVDTSRVMTIGLIVDDMPAIAGGGSTVIVIDED
jgi:hypothetical protein